VHGDDRGGGWPVDIGEVGIRVLDRGPEPDHHKDRRLFAPWHRYQARLAGVTGVRAIGWSVFEAVYSLVANHRRVFDERWPSDFDAGGCDGHAR